jgi:SPP1 family predicted phage head-tail adaptor
MKAGPLRHRVRIDQFVTTLDSDGERTESWEDVFGFLIPAQIVPLSGKELIAAAATQSKLAARIVVRFPRGVVPGVVPSMRVVHRETSYGIEAVVPDKVSGVRYLTLHCTAGAAEG